MFHSSRLMFGGLALAAGLFVLAPSAMAQQWGTLKGRFVVEGKTPEPAPLTISQNQELCGKHKLVDESLVVGPKGELANVLIYVRDKSVDVSPEYAKTAKDNVVLDNKDCRFEPHVVVMRTTQSLVIKNSDPAPHNTNVELNANTPFNDMVPPGAKLAKVGLTNEESRPSNVSCNIHPWMKAILLIRSNPYFAVSKADGTFEIKDLPAGKPLDFQVWQEKSGYVKDVKGAEGFATDSKGRVKYTVKPGVTDLGDIKVPASLFAK